MLWRQIKKYNSLICSVIAIFAITVAVLYSAVNQHGYLAAAGNITNWGIKFRENGKVPDGNASAEELAKYGALYVERTEEKRLYLTFDAGFEDGTMPQILDTLKKHRVQAAFFLVGHYFEVEPDLVRRMAEEGHIVANHTYSHPDMSKIADRERFKEELEKNEKLYKEITGEDMTKLYRPPSGKFSVQNLKMADELGYKTLFWSLAYVDWYKNQQPSKQEAFSKLIPRIHPGAIVLLHSTSTTNAKILDELLEKWKEEGYAFGEIESLLETVS